MEDTHKNSESIEMINGVKFTPREIDILACILGGRTGKKIASYLGLSRRTVENYTRNIMIKIECNSKESILDFLEKSDNVQILRQHYSTLFSQASASQEENQVGPSLPIPFQNHRNKICLLLKRHKKLVFLCGFILFLIVSGVIWIILKSEQNAAIDQSLSEHVIRSDLNIPSDSFRLDRPQLISELKEKLKDQKGIQTVALVGPGGAGKTTLARQYIHQKNGNVIWEVNAETYETLKSSFENLSQALAKTEQDQKKLKIVQEIKNPTEREEKIILFVKDKLRSHSNWVILFDNVEKFSDIQKYFPQDLATWGEGQVIVTTRDNTIQNNKHINEVMQIGELTPDQKLTLFSKIMNHEKTEAFTPSEIKEAKVFLEKLPPFPLDISVAAYYLKATNISYVDYLEKMNQCSQDFEKVQESLLKEAGDYTKTRYGIITLSLERLINTHKDFAELSLFASLLDSQDIPKDLLIKYKNSNIVENFIYNLKKYSLITSQSSADLLDSNFSIHRSTQIMTLSYLKMVLNLNKNNELIESLCHFFENYIDTIIDKQDFPAIRNLLNHCKAFLNHDSLINNSTKSSLSSSLGSIYYVLFSYEKGRDILNEALVNLHKYDRENYVKISQTLTYLGAAYRELGEHEKARGLLEQSLAIYKNHVFDNPMGIARIQIYLGNAYTRLGHYKQAKDYLEQSSIIYNQYLPKDHHKIAWISAYLGNINKKLGKYKESKELLEKSLKIYKQNFSSDHFRFAWASVSLGSLYVSLGKYEEAKNLLEHAVKIYRNSFSDHHVNLAWISVHLGRIYIYLKDYKKARELIEKSLRIYTTYYPENDLEIAWGQKYLGVIFMELENYEQAEILFEKSLLTYKNRYGMDHVETARILRNFGQLHLQKRYMERGENFFFEALKIFKKNNHPDIYMIFEDLAELNLLKYNLELEKQDESKAQTYKTQSVEYLNKALEVIKASFPEDCPHKDRIEDKLKAMPG